MLHGHTLDASDQFRLGPDEILVKPNSPTSGSSFEAGETLTWK
jgi:hypothetical protein